MEPEYKSQYEMLQEQHQIRLIEFLEAELDIGRTMVATAQHSMTEGDVDHWMNARNLAQKAAETVRNFVDQVRSASARSLLKERLSEFDALLAGLPD